MVAGAAPASNRTELEMTEANTRPRRALVTGATSGLGRAIAQRLAGRFLLVRPDRI
jgi:hypothetical protein